MTECVVCGVELTLPANPEKGELLDCRDCGTELEITGTDPIQVQQAPEEQEDWGE